MDNEIEKDKFKSTVNDLENNYDDHLNEMLPKLHRGDIASSNRTLGLIDSVMATSATFLIIPIRNLKKLKDGEDLSDFFFENRLEFVMFFLGFAVVLTIWENINIRAMVIKRVDDLFLFFICLEMLATTVLPFSIALQGHYPSEVSSILLTCFIIGFMNVNDIILSIYAMKTPRVLHVMMQKWTKPHLNRFQNCFIVKPVISLMLVSLSASFCVLNYAVSWFILSLLIMMPVINKCYYFIRRRIMKPTDLECCRFYYCFTKGNISKERIETMSDAAVAIIACILILDITVEDFPFKEKVYQFGLNYELNKMHRKFLTFLATFSMVLSLWFVNHTIFHLYKSVNAIIFYLQKTLLAFACLCPLAGNLVLKLSTAGNKNSNHAIRISALIIFFSSSANLLILLYGLFFGKRYLHPWAVFGCFKVNARQHLYTILKAFNLPFWSLVCVLGTLGSPNIALYSMYACYIGSVVTTFSSKLLFMNNFGKKSYAHELQNLDTGCTEPTKIDQRD
ncbi:endosomal/lysosomal proton channel TMEM175 [Hydra vulgaris]|uniref:endosomal/lysosomal proton channel TMEM175 n=1 Tax=Hydra vulgaris TaxID=6087 RepID=UPI0032EA593A